MTPLIQARCETVRPEAGNVKVFTLRVQGGHFDFLQSLQAGKHVALSYPDTGGIVQQRLYSITRKPDDDLFEIAVKGSGRNSVSDHLHATLREGMTVPLQYVAGDISVDSILGYQRIAMIAGGIGITLPIALLRELAHRANKGQAVPYVQLLLSIPHVSDIPFLHELLALDLSASWFSLSVFVTRDNIRSSAQFKVGRPSSETLQHLQDPEAVVICGSYSFAQALREYTVQAHPVSRMLIEAFSPPAAPAVDIEPVPGSAPLQIHVPASGLTLSPEPGSSLLEMLEAGQVPIRSQCRAGICGACRVSIANSDGDCRFEPDFCLSDQDKAQGHALACCTFPLSGTLNVDIGTTS
ncbi:2Fe-2S iron-sulfur cluster-binding protein [Alcaligenes sp. SDU_A2]|uniref:2Fe-2S iron-sulfur cluster-binding protein n=1 Tax=Alcaligenes sp. SDU_A2 TaxID=3136634 RepID=UPI002CDE35E8|nr:2Fe-2S iron-sulfur cluster-binding protein [Alcaligenes sp.]HRL26416.1 2Fe-2S iron-sulfur cluster-binding protein [Alcaligenes sp.]